MNEFIINEFILFKLCSNETFQIKKNMLDLDIEVMYRGRSAEKSNRWFYGIKNEKLRYIFLLESHFYLKRQLKYIE